MKKKVMKGKTKMSVGNVTEPADMPTFKKGGMCGKKAGGSIDGVAQRGKTKGKIC